MIHLDKANTHHYPTASLERRSKTQESIVRSIRLECDPEDTPDILGDALIDDQDLKAVMHKYFSNSGKARGLVQTDFAKLSKMLGTSVGKVEK